MRPRCLNKLLKLAALLAVVLTAQTAALAHTDLADSHPASEVCALCVGLAGLGAGNVSTPTHFEVVAATPVVVDYVRGHVFSRRTRTRCARGPPRAS